VGEVMAIGRTFPESFQKALRSLETGRYGFNCDPTEREYDAIPTDELVRRVSSATPERPFLLGAALRRGVTVDRLYQATGIDPWYLHHLASLVRLRAEVEGRDPTTLSRREWKEVKRAGFADAQLSYLWGIPEPDIFAARSAAGVSVTYKTVDTCAAEFAAETPYHYGTYEDDCEVAPLTRPAVVILGSGPNRIGQGVEFDYCCVHAAFALSDAGFETVMVNCNPETVSTDYDTSDRLFFEPLTPEDVLAVCRRLQLRGGEGGGELTGVIVSLGGQTPLKLAHLLEDAGIPVLGTSPASIDLAEDREQFLALCERLAIQQPPGGTATTPAQARAVAERLGFPVLVRPSYVLGGRAMQIVYDMESLDAAMAELAAEGSLGREGGLSAERPVLVDRFLEDAIEVDVDALRDAEGEIVIGGVMEHIEEAGVHSGDSACAIPPQTLSAATVTRIETQTRALAAALDVRGLINVQWAVKSSAAGSGVAGSGNGGSGVAGSGVAGDEVYILEANPRASRTVPFVSKATGVPLAKIAARVMGGATLAQLRAEGLLHPPAEGGHVAVKEAVLPFNRFPTVDTVLGPEMRSTGEVMGIDRSFGMAFAKSQTGAWNKLPSEGTIFFSLADRDKPHGIAAARHFAELGFRLVATAGTAAALTAEGVPVDAVVGKLTDPVTGEPVSHEQHDAVELLESGAVHLVVNTPRGRGPRADGAHIRRTATVRGIPCLTTVAAALAAAAGLAESAERAPHVSPLQAYHRDGQLRLEV
jgi:carbamoyl-phosphate synthase large subunit